MAVIKFTNSKSTLKHIINYITQDAKTTTELITGKDCTSDNALEEMQTVKNLYNKTTGRQYIHLVQSFSPNDNLSYDKAHEIGLELAKQYKGFQVLVATHTDREHVHNHLVINSVSFEDGKKFQQSKKDMEKIKIHSNELCAKNGLSTISLKGNSKVSNSLTLKEYQVANKGQSWKMQLINAIDYSIENSLTKKDFISNMNSLGYQVNWTDSRKSITYTTPTGMKCRDNKLYDISLKNDEKRNITEDKVSEFKIIGDYIYYINTSDKNCLYRLNKSSTETQKIYEKGCKNLSIESKNLLFIDSETGIKKILNTKDLSISE